MRAYLRAELWDPETWPEPLRVLADAIDANVEKGRTDL